MTQAFSLQSLGIILFFPLGPNHFRAKALYSIEDFRKSLVIVETGRLDE